MPDACGQTAGEPPGPVAVLTPGCLETPGQGAEPGLPGPPSPAGLCVPHSMEAMSAEQVRGGLWPHAEATLRMAGTQPFGTNSLVASLIISGLIKNVNCICRHGRPGGTIPMQTSR